ncbi:hypothetical protein CTI12_AA602250 [Artemisia annua]|uniref:Uncharacterized protein n=1 Tax=Artemisia annua TaxID=35608 RepID=A0A2U1KHT4_ARTAN|nr:hypothetical protein CTI12_AA602250 [Artemisia annua]
MAQADSTGMFICDLYTFSATGNGSSNTVSALLSAYGVAFWELPSSDNPATTFSLLSACTKLTPSIGDLGWSSLSSVATIPVGDSTLPAVSRDDNLLDSAATTDYAKLNRN